MSATQIDVMYAFRALLSFGGMFEPKRVIAEWNSPKSTSLLANRCVPIGQGDRPKTASVLRALQRAEQDGLVQCVGTGAEHNKAWNKNAADCKERWWVLTNAGLESIGVQS